MSPAHAQLKKSWSQRSAAEFEFRSSIAAPISGAPLERQGLLFAEISLLGHLRLDQRNLAAGRIGFTDGKPIVGESMEAHWFQNRHASVVVVTAEPGTARSPDWLVPEPTPATTAGVVHRPFQEASDQIWPTLESALESNNRPLWFCGHGMGGAVALLLAIRCTLSRLKMEPEAVFTFGSPRAASREHLTYVPIQHRRWVNHRDPLPRMPSSGAFCHLGQALYLDQFSRLKPLSTWRQYGRAIDDRWQQCLGRPPRELADHPIEAYVDALTRQNRKRDRSPDASVRN